MPEKKIESFQDLVVWQKAHQVVLSVYRLTKMFPVDERYVLVSQMRRSAVSVTSNIAEGFARRQWKDKTRFYYIAQSSGVELLNQVIIARDLGYVQSVECERLVAALDDVGRLLTGLIKSISQS